MGSYFWLSTDIRYIFEMDNSLIRIFVFLFSLIFTSRGNGNSVVPGPFKGLVNKRESPQNPDCVWFTPQDDLPSGTAIIYTYMAPDASLSLELGLSGDGVT